MTGPAQPQARQGRKGQRLDKELLARGLAPSRTRAGRLIAAGEVLVDGDRVLRPSTLVTGAQRLEVTSTDRWVSRAAHKLLGALDACAEVGVAGRRCLDVGASTGGFTQVLLTRAAAGVVAVDVGHDQLAGTLRDDPRVEVHEGLNIRDLTPGMLGAGFDLIVADLSFISLRLVVSALAGQCRPGTDLLLMVKPQFEVGRHRLPRTGVVTDPSLRTEAVTGVIDAAAAQGLGAIGAHRSQLPGQDGNREFFLHLRAGSEVTVRLDTLDVAD